MQYEDHISLNWDTEKIISPYYILWNKKNSMKFYIGCIVERDCAAKHLIVKKFLEYLVF